MSDLTFKPGDIITIAGDYVLIPNPNRRWWGCQSGIDTCNLRM